MRRYHIDLGLIGLLGLLAVIPAYYSGTGIEQISLVGLAILSCGLAGILGSLLIGYRLVTRRLLFPPILAPLLSLGIIISIAATQWPLRITYALSRDSLDAAAERLRAGEHIATPVRIGFFTVREAELSWRGIPCLWTQSHPAGNTGFVQCRRDYVPFNLWSIVRLDDHWQFISED